MIHIVENGFYRVGDRISDNKFYAMMDATKSGTNLTWEYYDDIFDKACQTFRGYGMSMKEMYRIRAQQLRDQYDYLILNYSGGADSHNILHVFLDNDIKLDMIHVQWPMSLMDKGLYKANTQDKSNFNFHSEWDFALKKDLEWIGKNRPDIKIEITDWAETVTEDFYGDDMFANNVTNIPSIARAQKQNTFPPTEAKLADMGLKVASIYGVDKLAFTMEGGRPRFRFNDNACMAQPNPENPNGMEYFYWTPNMPEIPILQAHKLFKYFETRPELMADLEFKADKLWYQRLSTFAEHFKFVCYPYWDFNRFQADKPFSVADGLKPGVRAWDNILLKALPEFDRTQQRWEYLWNSYKGLIRKDLLVNNQDTARAVFTKWHEIKFD